MTTEDLQDARRSKRRKASDFTAVHQYHLEVGVAVETNHQMLGNIEATFSSGDVTPRSEAEEVALQLLVDAGRATIKES